MPTYLHVPQSFTSLPHRKKVLFLYRHILRQGASFFDERASLWIQSKTQETFRKHKFQKDEKRVHKYMTEARQALRLLERANQIDLKAVTRILKLSYGLQGKERRILLQPFIDSTRARTLSVDKLSTAIMASASSGSLSSPSSMQSSDNHDAPTPSGTIRDSTSQHRLSEHLLATKKNPSPLFYDKERTIPPIMSTPLESLIHSATGKGAHPILPVPPFKPLHGKREANLRWRFFTKQIRKVKPLLPAEIRREIEQKSRLGLSKGSTRGDGDKAEMLETELQLLDWEQRTMETIRAWNKAGEKQKESRWEDGRFHPSIGGKPAKSHTLTPRLYRRIWQQLLDDIPIMDINLINLGESTFNSDKDKDTGSRSSPRKQAYSIRISEQSHHARTSAGLKLQALVNDFDRLGFTESSVQQPRTKQQKAPKT
ncbi:hypothetical protein FBU30_010460 [Linnemannia zychae]|nr:hypothetical protein FBU30_010460 [Linnemannia zychae]